MGVRMKVLAFLGMLAYFGLVALGILGIIAFVYAAFWPE